MVELEPIYASTVANLQKNSLNLSKWLPSLAGYMRAIVPGELVMIIADTGVGKTALLSNLAIEAAPLVTLFFELELPAPLLYERILAAHLHWPATRVEQTYRDANVNGECLGADGLSKLHHIHVCTRSRLTIEQIERLIVQSELKIGSRPKLVLLDYIQLVQGEGKSRYERVSTIAEDLKIMAKATDTIVVVASQIHRKPGDSGPEIALHDAKDSGSIENSAGLILGAWRDSESKSVLWLKVLKNTKGESGRCIRCLFYGESLTIKEATQDKNP
jgi:replicative DNA helicase